jgi:hypothetical protein
MTTPNVHFMWRHGHCDRVVIDLDGGGATVELSPSTFWSLANEYEGSLDARIAQARDHIIRTTHHHRHGPVLEHPAGKETAHDDQAAPSGTSDPRGAEAAKVRVEPQ